MNVLISRCLKEELALAMHKWHQFIGNKMSVLKLKQYYEYYVPIYVPTILCTYMAMCVHCLYCMANI